MPAVPVKIEPQSTLKVIKVESLNTSQAGTSNQSNESLTKKADNEFLKPKQQTVDRPATPKPQTISPKASSSNSVPSLSPEKLTVTQQSSTKATEESSDSFNMNTIESKAVTSTPLKAASPSSHIAAQASASSSTSLLRDDESSSAKVQNIIAPSPSTSSASSRSAETSSSPSRVMRKRRIIPKPINRTRDSTIIMRLKSSPSTDQPIQENPVEKFFKDLPNCVAENSEATLDRMKSLIGEESFKALQTLFVQKDSSSSSSSLDTSLPPRAMRSRSKSSTSHKTHKTEAEQLLEDLADSFIGKDLKESIQTQSKTLRRSRKSNEELSMTTRSGTKIKPVEEEESSDSKDESEEIGTESENETMIHAPVKRATRRMISETDESPCETPRDSQTSRLSSASTTSSQSSASTEPVNVTEEQTPSEVKAFDEEECRKKFNVKNCYLKNLEKLDITLLKIQDFYEEVEVLENIAPVAVTDQMPVHSSEEDVKPDISALAPIFNFEGVIVIDDDEENFVNANKCTEFTLVSNLSFRKSTDSSATLKITYRCIPGCDYTCYNLGLLKYHVERHVMTRFTGFCQICQKHINKNISSLKDEIEHMEWHAQNGNIVMPDPPVSNTIGKRRMTTYERIAPKRSRFLSTDSPAGGSKLKSPAKHLAPLAIQSTSTAKRISISPTKSTITAQPSTTQSTQDVKPLNIHATTSSLPKPGVIIDLDLDDEEIENNISGNVVTAQNNGDKELNNNSTSTSAPEDVNKEKLNMPPPAPAGIRIRSLPGDQLSGRITPKKNPPQSQFLQPAQKPKLFQLLATNIPGLQIPNNIQVNSPSASAMNRQGTSINAQNIYVAKMISLNGPVTIPRMPTVQTQPTIQTQPSIQTQPTVQPVNPTRALFINNPTFQNQSNITPDRQPIICLSDQRATYIVLENTRPWLRETEVKTALARYNMLSDANCLLNFFKCMASNCSFSCNEPGVFFVHLNEHKNTNQTNCNHYMRCAYCRFVGDGHPSTLVNHIVNYHRCYRFSCTKCFFSSTRHVNVQLHFKKYHEKFIKVGQPFYYVRENVPLMSSEDELNVVKKNKEILVKPIKCSGE